MSGLSLKIRVITHDRTALENMLEYKVDNASWPEWKRRKSANATIGKVFFKGCDIEEFSHARHMYYIEARECAIERSYFPTIMLIEQALNGRGMIYAEGFDDGSGMDGAVIWAWDHVLTLGEANSEIKELKRSGRFPNVKFQANAGAFLRKSIEYLMYYDRYLPAELKEDYLIHQQEAMKAINDVCAREKERFLRRQAQLLDREAARSRRSQTIEFAGKSFAFYSVFYMEEEQCSEYTPDINDVFEEKLNARGAIIVESGMEDYYVMEVEENIDPAEHEIFSDYFSVDYRNDKVQHVCEGDVWKALKETPALPPDEAEIYIKQAKQTIEQRVREDRQIALDRIRDHVGVDGFGEQGVPEIREQLFCLCDVKRTKYRGVVHMADLLEQELRKRGAASVASLQKCADCIVYDGEDWLPERSEEFAQKYSVRLMMLSDLWKAIFATPELSGSELAALPSNEEIRQQKKHEQEKREVAQKEAARLQRQQEREEAKRQAELMRQKEKEKAKADKEAQLKAEQDRKAAQIRQAEEEKQKQEEARCVRRRN